VVGQHACKLIGDRWELGIQPLGRRADDARQGQKNTASQDQTRQSRTDDRAGNGGYRCRERRITGSGQNERAARSSEGQAWIDEGRPGGWADRSA